MYIKHHTPKKPILVSRYKLWYTLVFSTQEAWKTFQRNKSCKLSSKYSFQLTTTY